MDDQETLWRNLLNAHVKVVNASVALEFESRLEPDEFLLLSTNPKTWYQLDAARKEFNEAVLLLKACTAGDKEGNA